LAKFGVPSKGRKKLAFTILLLTCVELCGGYVVWKYKLQYRYTAVPSLGALPVPDAPNDPPLFKSRMANQSWAASASPQEKSVAALRWTMAKVLIVADNGKGHDAEALLRSVENGNGAICSQMAVIYSAALATLGMPSRTVWLFRNFPGGDTHTLVEVAFNGRWVIMDPTFGVYYRDKNGEMLSAQDIKRKLFQGDYKDIEPVFIGGEDAKYPVRLNRYYMNFLPLFTNVFVKPNDGTMGITEIVPLRFLLGERVYFERIPGETDDNMIFAKGIYFVFGFLLPLVLLALGVILALRMVINHPLYVSDERAETRR
jgi:hypothetical protein